MKLLKFKMLICCLLLMVLTPLSASEVRFTVEAILPANQIGKDVTYHHLKVNPGEKQTIRLNVISVSDEPVEVEASIHLARSNHNGLIVYDGDTDGVQTENLKYNIEDIACVKNKTVTVPPRGSVPVEVDLLIPDGKFDGILLGGINFKEVNKGQASGMKQSYSYNSALVLTMDDTPQLNGSTSLEITGSRTEVVQTRKITMFDFANNESRILNKLNVDIVVTDKNDNEVLKTSMISMSISPNTRVPVQLDWKLKDVESGQYVAHIKANNEDDVWEWNYPFEISADTAKTANEETLFKVGPPQWIHLVLPILGSITLLLYGVVGYRIRLRKRMER